MTARKKSSGERLPRGFTLIEVLVAASVGAVVVATAYALLRSTTLLSESLSVAIEREDRERNADRLLRSVLERIDVSSERFGGTSTEVHFASWWDVPHGWQEQRVIQLMLETDGTADSLTLALEGVERITLDRGMIAARFVYLSDASAGGRWQQLWGDARSVPLALGIVNGRDTTILRIGASG